MILDMYRTPAKPLAAELLTAATTLWYGWTACLDVPLAESSDSLLKEWKHIVSLQTCKLPPSLQIGSDLNAGLINILVCVR